ncbi:MAG: site-specific DNA-methyltransferase [Anaerolineae bacterium]|nr:site-specific DNA-methyltransferase [Thermoflexales bacterium]MDW8407449.1 site-specific DNA-methyltransferase [Anaerolineae bacterium]
MTNCLIVADCLDALARLKPGSVRLIYLDPPFNTGARRRASAGSYRDAFGSPAHYIAYMRPRVEAMLRVLSPDGSLFFHCDWRMSHHVRLMLDELFCVSSVGRARLPAGAFVNEIVWRYGLGAARAGRRLLTKHDLIFWYARSPGYVFNPLREPPTPAMLDKYRHVDEHGNRYMNAHGKRYRMPAGKLLDDVWDIPTIAPTAKERVDYPTQKPLALLKRIVALASNVGDIVLDPFCGSGTTLVAARQLGRRWIGIDINPQAIEIARARLGQVEKHRGTR